MRYNNLMQMILEYNIILPITEKTERKLCSIREQIIGIAMASEREPYEKI